MERGQLAVSATKDGKKRIVKNIFQPGPKTTGIVFELVQSSNVTLRPLSCTSLFLLSLALLLH
jgi:hypothetical protein